MQAPVDPPAATVVEAAVTKDRRRSRPKRRELFCPAHPEQRIEGNGKKYFLHLLSPGQLAERGIKETKAKLIIQAYPVLVLSNEFLKKLLKQRLLLLYALRDCFGQKNAFVKYGRSSIVKRPIKLLQQRHVSVS